MTTRSDPLDAADRGKISSDLRALIAIAPDALTASLERFTKNGALPGSGAFTRIECSVDVLLGSACVGRLSRGTTFSVECRARPSLPPAAFALRAEETPELAASRADPPIAPSALPARVPMSLFSSPATLAPSEFAAGPKFAPGVP